MLPILLEFIEIKIKSGNCKNYAKYTEMGIAEDASKGQITPPRVQEYTDREWINKVLFS